jgi:hypothetical protein
MDLHTGIAKNKKENETDVRVTYWHIPGGCDYENAKLKECWFDDKENATKFCKRYEAPPAMACIG